MDKRWETSWSSRESVAAAGAKLRDGGVIAFPTETVYGLGADATNAQAVARIFEIKGRPRFDPLIVHTLDADHARSLVTDWPVTAQRLAERFWPGPMTLVLPKKSVIQDIVTAGLPTVGVRVPDHPIARLLIESSGKPIAAPSANRFGEVSPTTALHVMADLGGDADAILDGGPCRAGVESTVISLVSPKPTLLRPGGVSIEEIEAVIGSVDRMTYKQVMDAGAKDDSAKAAMSPGMQSCHYATGTGLIFVRKEGFWAEPGYRMGLIALLPSDADDRFAEVEILCPSGVADLRVAAANLFAAMRRLDEKKLNVIIAYPVPEEGLGLAINDRLARASV